jgi:hypothetical protein
MIALLPTLLPAFFAIVMFSIIRTTAVFVLMSKIQMEAIILKLELVTVLLVSLGVLQL